MKAQSLRILCIAAFCAVALAVPGRAQPKSTPPGQLKKSDDNWFGQIVPTTKPWEYVKGDPGKVKKSQSRKAGGVVINSVVDPGANIVYSGYTDNPDADPAVRNLAENLGNDPIRMYEWVRNNVRTEFYFGASRGACLTMLERAGNDIDQCALLGALFKAAGYTPTYRLEWMWIPRTATGANQVGVYEWLGVTDDASALSMLSAVNWQAPYAQSFDANGYLNMIYMWVSIDIPGRGETKFVPSIKPHAVGRQVNLDSLSGYIWNDAAVASGSGSTGSSSGAVSQTDLRNYFTGRSVAASEAIRTSATLHDLSGAELARLPTVVSEVVSVTAPNATRYPQGLQYTDNSQATALAGIPETYCSWLRVKIGSTVEEWFDATSLLGRPLAVEFDGNGYGIIRHDGVQVGATDTSGNSTGTVPVEITYEPPSAYFGGTAPQYIGTQTVARQNSVAVVYAFGRTVDRLQKTLRDVSAKEADNAASVTTTDRLQVIGQQYVSQVSELTSLSTAYLGYDFRRQFFGGLTYLADGKPVVDMRINLSWQYARSSSAAPVISVFKAVGLLMGALEGTTLEQHSGNKSFGTPSLFDHAMTLGYGATYFSDVGAFNSSGLANNVNTYVNPNAAADIQAHLSAGGAVVLLSNSNVTYGGQPFGGYLKVYPDTGGVATIMGNSYGGVSTGSTGAFSFITRLWTSSVRFVRTVFSKPPSVSSDPVDLATGAFLKSDTDLVLGNTGEPTGLQLTRYYSSGRVLSDPAGLGRGWTHSYHMKLDVRSPMDMDAQRATYDEVLPVLLAMRHAQDTLNYEPLAARSWLLSCTALTWAVNEQIDTRATIALGDRYMEFIKRPNGSYAPGSAVTATLTKQSDGSHDLAFRHGNTIHFQASDGKFDTITDQSNNILTAAYTGSKLSTVTDAYNRTLTFNYTGDQLTGVSDSTGRSVGYGYNGNNFIFTDAEGKAQTLEMTADHLLTKVVDARGRAIVENDYDAWDRVSQQRTFGDASRLTKIWITPGVGTEVDPLGGAVRTYFDASGRKIFVVDQLNHLAQWQYDGVDRLVKTITPKGFTSTYAYNADHNLVSETNPANHTRTTEYDAQLRPWKVRNFEGQETVFTYTAQHKVDTITAPGGMVSSFQYDARGRLWKAHPTAYAANEFDVYAYDASGHVDTITHPADTNTGDQDFDDYSYNARGDLLELIDRKDVRTTYTYNNRRQATSVTQWEGATPRTSQTVYDDTGDIDYTLDASGRKVDSEHDAFGHLTQVKRGPAASQVVTLANSYSDVRTLLTTSTDALGNPINYTYHATQQVATVRDPLNRTTTLGYDEDQRATTSQTPLGFLTTQLLDSRSFKDGAQDAESQLTDYTYDKDGRMTTLANRLNKAFNWNYDDANRTVSSTTPTGKTTTSVAGTRGLPATVAEPSGQTTTFSTYDTEGRLLTKTDGVGTTTYTYWPNGLLKDVTESGHTTHREYDVLNRLSLYQDGEGNTLHYTYHPSGELATITYPGNKTVTYGYDDFGRLWHVTDWSNRTTTYTYDAASRLTRLDRPNGTYRVQEYDAASQLRFVKEYKSDNSIITYQELRYDDDGRITSNFIHPKPAASTLAFDDLLYDDDNRLSTWNAQSVVFDADGNMTNGPLPSGTLSAYGYDSRNRLTSAGGSSYRYSPDGHRVEVTGPGAATYVVGPSSDLLMRTKGGTTTYYVYGLGLLYEETNGATLTYHADQVGSTLALTNDSQTETDRWSYSPYGAITSHTIGTTDTPFCFNGTLGVQTDANGLYYMRARYYNPRLMRFCNADPIGFGGGMNHYAFVGNNPISFTDPMGLERQNSGATQLPPYVVTARRTAGDIADYVQGLVNRQRSLFPGAVFLPAPAEVMGKRDYYVFRYLASPSEYYTSAGDEYYLDYGYAYIQLFTQLGIDNPDLWSFVTGTRIALQRLLEEQLRLNPDALKSRAAVAKIAYDTHDQAYRAGGLGKLTPGQAWSVWWVAARRGDAFSGPAFKEAAQSWDGILSIAGREMARDTYVPPIMVPPGSR